MKELKSNKGITLIALVITIIVMLILVAVTVTMAVNGGLFSFAGKAAGDTKNARDEEQQLASGQITVGNKVYNSIDEYLGVGGTTGGNPEENPGGDETEKPTEPDDTDVPGVAYSELTVGDYVNYPVYYENVGTWVDTSTGEVKGNTPRAEYVGWRILSIEGTGNNQYVKLISAGVPLNYYHGSVADTSVTNLTTGFFSTPINSTLTVNSFYKSGFKTTETDGTMVPVTTINDLKTLFTNNSYTQIDTSNNNTPKVQAMTKADLDKVYDPTGATTTSSGTSVNGSTYNSLLAIPCGGNESSVYALTWLASRFSDKTLGCVSNAGTVDGNYGSVKRCPPHSFSKI